MPIKMKKAKKIKRISRTETKLNIEPIKRILVAYLFLWFAWIIIVPGNFSWSDKVTQTDKLLTFQFHWSANEWWVEEGVHGAADDKWWYLFDENLSENKNQVYTGTINVNQNTNVGSTSILTTQKYVRIVKWTITIKNYYVAIESNVFNKDLAKYYLENYLEWPRNTVVVWSVNVTGCVTPRDEAVEHWDFVIAYQQRTDVDNICNVQKRYCNDGYLNWTYTQESCKENAPYAYEKIIPTSENEKISNEYVQPNKPINADAEFSSQWKINETLDPITVWYDQPANAQIVNNKDISQVVVNYPDCKTPRWEKVKNWQFVKAYLNSKGNITSPCDVELRMCVNGKLKWTYTNETCKYSDVVLNKKTYKIK